MRMDPRLVPVLARFADAGTESPADPVAERAAELADVGTLVGTLTRPVPSTVTWSDTVTDDDVAVPIRIYTPSRPGPRAALVYAHGGAWRTGSPATTHEHAGTLAADADVVVVSVDYRLIPEHPFPAGLDDVWHALLWTAAHADQLGIDPHRIAVGGSSAGGNLAAAVCLRARDEGGPPIALQLLEAAVLDLRRDTPSWDEARRDLPPLAAILDDGLSRYVASGAEPADPNCSPLAAVDLHDLPPAVLLAGEADPLRDDSVRYADRLGAAGVRAALQLFPGIVHGTENFVELMPIAQDWHRTCVAALRALVARPDADVSGIPPEVVGLVSGAGLTRGVLFEHLGVPAAGEDALITTTLGITSEQLAALRAGFMADVGHTADKLLTDPAFAAALDRLPFTPGDRIAVVGDSLSAAANSWANLLAELLDRRGVTVLNRAVSGRTTTETISVFGHTLAMDPDWILLMIGANDVRRHGTRAGVRQLSLAESVRNLGELRRMAAENSRARVVTIPSHPVVDPARIEQNRAAGTFWLVEDLDEARRVIVESIPDALDVHAGIDPGPGYWAPDGVHPSAEGQQQLLRAIVDALGNVQAAVRRG